VTTAAGLTNPRATREKRRQHRPRCGGVARGCRGLGVVPGHDTRRLFSTWNWACV